MLLKNIENLKMNMKNNCDRIRIEDVFLDPTNRLDVIYWKKFAIDLNNKTKFSLDVLDNIGHVVTDTVQDESIQKEKYYTFKITYTGRVKLSHLIETTQKTQKMKIVKKGNLVFSRINCCRGAIGIIQDFQENAICTNETHIFNVIDPNVDARYLQIILRHPYYQDKMLSECTGLSLERMRFSEDALKIFEVPVPSLPIQLSLIKKILNIETKIKSAKARIVKIRHNRNKSMLTQLGIQLSFSEEKGQQYYLSIDDVKENPTLRLDFEHNRPSFNKIKKISQGKYQLITIENLDPETKILTQKITSGSTPDGGIYPTKGILFLQVGNIKENKIDVTEHEFITPEFHSSLSRSHLIGGEVLVTIAGTIGKSAVNTEKNANVNQAIAVLRLNNKINPLYLSAFLNSDGGRIQFAKYRHDFGTPNINQTELGTLKIPFPKLKIQNDIVSAVKKYEKEISKLEKEFQDKEKERFEHITKFLIGEKTYEGKHERLKKVLK